MFPLAVHKFFTSLTDVDPASFIEDDFNQATAVFIHCFVTEVGLG
jgi:hypothetical protein